MVGDAFQIGDHTHDGGDAPPVARHGALGDHQGQALLLDVPLHLVERVVAFHHCAGQAGVQLLQGALGAADGLHDAAAHLHHVHTQLAQGLGVIVSGLHNCLLVSQTGR